MIFQKWKICARSQVVSVDVVDPGISSDDGSVLSPAF